MSVFEAPNTEQLKEADKTKTSEEKSNHDSFLDRLVSEKGEQWKDPEALAKSHFHAQARIKELEEKVNGYSEQDYAKTLLEQLQAKQAPEVVTPQTPEVAKAPSDAGPEDTNRLSPEDVESLLEKALTKREKATTVEVALRDKFGDNANVVVHNKAKELGLSIKKMQEIAEDSPQAFLRLVGEPEKMETNKNFDSTFNSSSDFNSGNSTERNSAYYAKLRRSDRKTYDRLQVQMFDDRVRLGDKFYNT